MTHSCATTWVWSKIELSQFYCGSPAAVHIHQRPDTDAHHQSIQTFLQARRTICKQATKQTSNELLQIRWESHQIEAWGVVGLSGNALKPFWRPEGCGTKQKTQRLPIVTILSCKDFSKTDIQNMKCKKRLALFEHQQNVDEACQPISEKEADSISRRHQKYFKNPRSFKEISIFRKREIHPLIC